MFTEPEGQPPDRPIDLPHKILRVTSIGVVIAAIYAGSVLLYRWEQNRDYQAKQRQQAAAAQRAEDQESLETMGGTQFKILSFYAMPGEIRRGESVQMCYGVANAQTVKITPDIGRPMWPSLTRCIHIEPKKTTTYTLTAEDGEGKSKSVSLTIQVH